MDKPAERKPGAKTDKPFEEETKRKVPPNVGTGTQSSADDKDQEAAKTTQRQE